MKTDHGGSQTEGLLDFSVNINPLGPPACVAEILPQALPLLVRYPSLDAAPARQAVADRLGLDPAEVLVGNGATELISLLARALHPGRVWVLEPCYSEYRGAAEQGGVPVTRLPWRRNGSAFEPQWESLRPVPGDMVFVGFPNNPTGRFPDTAALDQAMGGRDGVWWVFDESFLDFAVPGVPSRVLPLRRGVIGVRSLTKFYAIPGLRLGYLLAERETVRRLHAAKDPWSVNGLAEQLTGRLLADRAYGERTREFVRSEQERVTRRLRDEARVEVFPGEVNFLLCRLPGSLDVQSLNRHLRREGMVVRDASTFMGLTPDHFRMGLRTVPENDRLIAALAEFTRGGQP